MNKNFKINKYKLKGAQSGMTLVELLVVLAIFVIVMGLTIFDYGRFRSSVSVQNLADDIALSIRRAQNYAIGVQNAQSDFSNGYGIHFSTATPTSIRLAGSNKSFIIFNDIPVSGSPNKKYDYDTASSSSACSSATLSSGNECLDLLTITSADEIKYVCPNGTGCTTGYADITFIRPNPDAYICTGSVGGSCSGPLGSVDIVVQDSKSQSIKTITVSSIGQISIR